MKTTFKRMKSGEVNVHFDGMTQGKAIALCNALSQHQTAVGRDVLISLHNAIQPAVNSEHRDGDQELFEATDIR